jgi:predicted nucleic-acid-binding protein
MLAVDTNVLVRLLAADDAAQLARARATVEYGIWIASTVVLETEWVLRSVYRLTPVQIADAFEGVAGLATVQFEHPDRLMEALSAVRQGMGFADALHRAAANDCEAFVTFDEDLVRAAGRMPGVLTRQP